MFDKPASLAIKQDLKQVERLFTDICQSACHDLIKERLLYVAASGGKRLRALLVIVFSKAMGNSKNEAHIQAATAIEMIHASTLLHDDVIDNAKLRRNNLSVYAKWGSKDSILAGDWLYASAFKSITELNNQAINKEFASVTIDLISGELLQSKMRWQEGDLQARYLDIIDKKTASVFALCGKTAALLNNSKVDINKWSKFAWLLGMSFQIMDDILDLTSEQTGKPLGNDLLEHKVTLPMLLAYPNLSPIEQQAIINADDNTDIKAIINAIEKAGGFKQAKITAIAYCEEALDILKTLDVSSSSYSNILKQLPNAILNGKAWQPKDS